MNSFTAHQSDGTPTDAVVYQDAFLILKNAGSSTDDRSSIIWSGMYLQTIEDDLATPDLVALRFPPGNRVLC